MTTTTFTIDCESCPARGRLCGDCFVPVLGRTWLETPTASSSPAPAAGEADGRPLPGGASTQEGSRAHPGAGLAPLDTDELAAVSAFVRAGLVTPEEAALARAELTAGTRSAAG